MRCLLNWCGSRHKQGSRWIRHCQEYRRFLMERTFTMTDLGYSPKLRISGIAGMPHERHYLWHQKRLCIIKLRQIYIPPHLSRLSWVPERLSHTNMAVATSIPAVVLTAFATIASAASHSFISALNACPDTCGSLSSSSLDWTVYNSIQRLTPCNRTLAIDFAPYTSLENSKKTTNI